MPIPLSALAPDPFLRVLMMGPWKLGKTTTAVTTAPRPVRVILCEDDSALDEARRMGADDYTDLERAMSYERPYEEMTTHLVQAKKDAQAGLINSVIIDPFTDFADRLLGQSMKLNLTGNGQEDGRTAYPHYGKRVMHCLELALTMPCHLIVIMHFDLQGGGGELPGQAKKQGEGICPNIQGKIRTKIGGKFRDVIWFDLGQNDERTFYTHAKGVWGPGCRSMPSKYTTMPADFGEFLKAMKENRPGVPVKMPPTVVGGSSNQKPKPMPPKPQANGVKPKPTVVRPPVAAGVKR